jgi:hypothetical protein
LSLAYNISARTTQETQLSYCSVRVCCCGNVFTEPLPRNGPGIFSYMAITYLLTELSPSILWNPKVQYRVHKSPPLVPILSHINPIQSIPSYLHRIGCTRYNMVMSPGGLGTRNCSAGETQQQFALSINRPWHSSLVQWHLAQRRTLHPLHFACNKDIVFSYSY